MFITHHCRSCAKTPAIANASRVRWCSWFWSSIIDTPFKQWQTIRRSTTIFSRPLANRTKGRAYATVLRLSVCLSVTLCIDSKRCVLEQKLLLTAYRKSYTRNRLVPNWMILTFV